MDQPLRILLIEDHQPDAELLERELRRDGLQFVLHRVDTREAFERALGDLRPDVILSDSNVPGFGGTEALKLAMERAPDVPFIVVSGAVDQDRKTEAIQRGATDYVQKAASQDRLAYTISRSLEAKRRR